MGRPSPCASCKLGRRRCATGCIFAPYFPSHDPQKFAVVHKVFGTRMVSKKLKGLPVRQRRYAARSLVYGVLEFSDLAKAWVRDPVYGCVGYISFLKNQLAMAENQLSELQKQLAESQAQILCTIQNHEAVKVEKGKEAFETAEEKELYVFAVAGERKHEAAEKLILKMKTFDLNKLPSDEDEDM